MKPLNFSGSRIKPLRLLWKALSKKRRQQLVAIQILSILSALGEVANIGALLPFLRLLANPGEGLRVLGPLAEPMRRLPSQHLLLTLGLAFMAVAVVSSLLRVVTVRSQLRLAALITADLGERVFASVLIKPYAWHLANNSSKVLTYVTKDVDAANFFVQSILLLGMNLLIVLMMSSALLAIAPLVMIVIGVLLISYYLLIFRFTRGNLRLDGEQQIVSYQRTVQVVQEGLGGIRDLLLDSTQSYFLSAYRTHKLRQELAYASIMVKAQVPRYLIEGFSMLLIVALSLVLALSGQGIEAQLPLLGTIVMGAYRLLQPLQHCFSSVSCMQANLVALKRLSEFLSETVVPIPIPVSVPQKRQVERGPLLALHKVSFRYNEGGPWVLRDLNLEIHRGERLAFVGTTGSGKTTCSDLILGLLAPTDGRVLIEGLDLHETAGLVKAWQRRVAHVPQQIYLSDASFAENIAFGVPEERIDLERVRRAAQQARISELIETNPEGYDAFVGERGVRLSGGQRQRIGIARALYKQAELLVLDEATSALDNRTEAEVMESVEALDRNITIIMIAHRLSTVERCDRIVMLECGMVSGIGNIRELQEGDRGFRKLAGNTK